MQLLAVLLMIISNRTLKKKEILKIKKNSKLKTYLVLIPSTFVKRYTANQSKNLRPKSREWLQEDEEEGVD
jgi:hypothetical protein